eukprot:14066360-Heterocapsa_arctica.AAC.1
MKSRRMPTTYILYLCTMPWTRVIAYCSEDDVRHVVMCCKGEQRHQGAMDAIALENLPHTGALAGDRQVLV